MHLVVVVCTRLHYMLEYWCLRSSRLHLVVMMALAWWWCCWCWRLWRSHAMRTVVVVSARLSLVLALVVLVLVVVSLVLVVLALVWLTVNCTFAGGCTCVGHRCTMW